MQINYLKDYSPPDFFITDAEFIFDLDETRTQVTAKLQIKRNLAKPRASKAPLKLDGEALKLQMLSIDGHSLMPNQYCLDQEALIIYRVPDKFVLQSQVIINPKTNKTLEGLYKSQDLLCTQCEPFGFRRITYFLDRPDVMAKYTVKLCADKKRYPVLLSNGNLIKQGDLSANRHFAVWQDKAPKPSYLFALVAGNLEYMEDFYRTKSRRKILTRIYFEKGFGNPKAARHAMQSLKAAMSFDEEFFGRECDVDTYMLVAINDFNCKAMENKGLNFFSNRFLMADPKTTVDDDYLEILDVVAHEYFHNWSGNRVTCRDWFQLSLKEGLTVFRDQIFMEQGFASDFYRILEVEDILTRQFTEDSGPLSHPVQPVSYAEMNNFYTATVYSKGAEVIYMLKTLLGDKVFYRAMREYFERLDGKAVTIDDLLAVIADVSNTDLTQFHRWYCQAGTPTVTVESFYAAKQQTYKLKLAQQINGKASKLVIPIKIGLLNESGQELVLCLQSKKPLSGEQHDVLVLDKNTATFTFIDIPTKPTPSLLRDFSAPVRLNYAYTEQELLWLMVNDTNIFNRWQASRNFWNKLIFALVAKYGSNEHEVELSELVVKTLATILGNLKPDLGITALLLELPTMSELVADATTTIDIESLHIQRKLLKQRLASLFYAALAKLYQQLNVNKPYVFNYKELARRKLKNVCLDYLVTLGEAATLKLAEQQYRQADNITDKLAGIAPLVTVLNSKRDKLLRDFYKQYAKEPFLVDKWFALQAEADVPNVLIEISALMQHQDFDLQDPNRARALIGTFANKNLVNFHAQDGSGYEFLATQVLKIDKFNPQLAAKMVLPLVYWQKFAAKRQKLMQQNLRRILNTKKLSKNLREIANSGVRRNASQNH